MKRLTTLLILLCVACMAVAAAATGAIPAAAEAADKAKQPAAAAAAHPASLKAADEADKREDRALARMKRQVALSILSRPKPHRPRDQATPEGDAKGPANRLRVGHPLPKYQSTLIVLKVS